MHDWAELTYPPRATEFLAKHLRQGELTLFIGSGASSGLGLPGWVELVNDLRNNVHLPSISSSTGADELQAAADEVRSKFTSNTEYFKLIKNCLYRNLSALSLDVLKNDLITAIGALLMGSKRGTVRRIVTLNFDSMLEWFTSLYGFVPRYVYKLPELEGGEDVRIYHPHGFLPHPSLNLLDSDFVILGLDSINERLGTPGDPWFEMVRHILRSGICIFVGMSERTFNDRSLAPLLNTVGKEVKSDRPTGVWLLDHEISQQMRDNFIRHNVVPLDFANDELIAPFLFGICQQAAVAGFS